MLRVIALVETYARRDLAMGSPGAGGASASLALHRLLDLRRGDDPDFRRYLGLSRPRERNQQAQRFRHSQSRPAADHPDPRWQRQNQRADEPLLASRSDGVPRARGFGALFHLRLSRMDLQQ